jgi:dUTP pyrophosphatase
MPESHGEWIDLSTAEDVVMEPGGFRIISLGVSMELPIGYYAQVIPRSSTCKNWGIIFANSIGVIENSYCGDDDIWGVPAIAIRHTEIPAGTRICQFHLVKQDEKVEFEQVETLGNANRGGFGSTGAK